MLAKIKQTIYKKIQQQTIDIRLIILITISMCTILFMLGGLYTWYERERVIAESKQLLHHSMQTQLRSINEWYQERFKNVETVSRLYTIRTENLEGVMQDFKASLKNNEDIDGYALVNTLGVAVVDTISPPGTLLSDREYYRRGMKGESFVTDIIVGKATGRKAVIFSVPVVNYENEIIGIVSATTSMQKLSNIMKNFGFTTMGISYLIDSDGNVIAQSKETQKPMEDFQSNEGFRSAIAGFSGEKIYTNQNGHRVVGSYHWIPERDWVILCEVEEEELLVPVYNQIIRFSIGSIFILLLALYSTWRISKNIQRPILLLLDSSKQTHSGDYSHTIEEEQFRFAPAEIRGLCHTFNVMIKTTNEHILRLYNANNALAAAEKKYRLLSTQDPLTQIYNRTYFELELSRLQTLQQVPVCVIGLDVDGLKLVNDTLGHKAGDSLIKAAAQVIKSSFPELYTVARIGGDEFAVLMPGAELTEMQAGIQRVQSAMIEYNNLHPELPLTISMGGAMATTLPLNIEDLISEADNIMYQEKNLNRERNRSILLSALTAAATLRDSSGYFNHPK